MNNANESKDLSEFHKLLKDFMSDLLNTFPEYNEKLGEEMLFLYNYNIEDDKSKCQEILTKVYEYCNAVFPERFFDVLYKNEEMFSKGLHLCSVSYTAFLTLLFYCMIK